MTAAKKGARAKAPSAQEIRIKKLEARVELLDWLHAELVYSVRIALAQVMLRSNPQIMQKIADTMAQNGMTGL